MNEKPHINLNSDSGAPNSSLPAYHRDIRVFMCYRRYDGEWYAEWLNENLSEAEYTDADGNLCRVRIYYDKAAPGVADWKKLHFPSLQVSKALVLICTPGIAKDLSRRGQPDWVYEELRWWIQHRHTSPIVIDATGEGYRWLPEMVDQKWPNINRIDLNKEKAEAATASGNVGFADRIRERVIGTIQQNERATVFEDLERFKRLTRRLTWALVFLGFTLFAALFAGNEAYQFSQKEALSESQKLKEQLKTATLENREFQRALSDLIAPKPQKLIDVTLKAFHQLTFFITAILENARGTEQIRESLVSETIASLYEMQKFAPERLDIQFMIARNHRLLGAIFGQFGKFQEALEEYRKSASLYEPMLRQEPTNALFYRELFASHFNSGLMLDQLGDRQGACKEYVESTKYAQKAAELDQQWAYLLDPEVNRKTQGCVGEK